uniref:Uncharacterized protein n=1 Tax=Mycena chlorophos TaxID=658473 RepID=A0ABQ0LME9_MYCCL|nr:predicted protein [Mycena chlorophos]
MMNPILMSVLAFMIFLLIPSPSPAFPSMQWAYVFVFPVTFYLLFATVPHPHANARTGRRRLASSWRDFRPVAKAPARWMSMDAPAVTNVYCVQLPPLGAAGAKQHRTTNAGSGHNSFGIQLTFPTRALRAQHVGRAGWQRIPDVEVRRLSDCGLFLKTHRKRQSGLSSDHVSEVQNGGLVDMPVHFVDDAAHTEAAAISPGDAVILPTHAECRL